MAKKFSFFDWARGRSSARSRRKGSDARRLAILMVAFIVVVGLIVAFRKIPWRSDDHPHEKGPHGGIITAINEGEPHYHAEVVVEDNGRIRLFLFGKDTDIEVAVRPQVFIASVKADHASRGSSVIFRPPSMADKTTQFIGRLLPSQMHQRLDVAVDKLEIADRVLSFRFELPGQHGHVANSGHAEAYEKQVLLKPGGKYTAADIEASGGVTASQKFGEIQVDHQLQAQVGDKLCPLTRVKADARIAWAIGGKTYLFCCPQCIVDFVELAKERPEEVPDP